MIAALPFGPGALAFIGLYLLSLLYLGWRGRKAQQENTLKDFSQQRAHWGELAKPQQLADVLFALTPEGRELRITVSSVFLNANTSMLQERTQTYTFSR